MTVTDVPLMPTTACSPCPVPQCSALLAGCEAILGNVLVNWCSLEIKQAPLTPQLQNNKWSFLSSLSWISSGWVWSTRVWAAVLAYNSKNKQQPDINNFTWHCHITRKTTVEGHQPFRHSVELRHGVIQEALSNQHQLFSLFCGYLQPWLKTALLLTRCSPLPKSLSFSAWSSNDPLTSAHFF